MTFSTWKLKDWELGFSFALSSKPYIGISLFKRYFTIGVK